jgi:aminoglycoside phosphotransferase family enzyme
MGPEHVAASDGGPSLVVKVAFLASPSAYADRPSEVTCRETHMSWVFLAGDSVYKLKKPVRFPYLDFSTLDRREWACRAEYAINRRLAPTVYRGVVPLTVSPAGLAIAGDGPVVDWLVVMRRLPEELMLDQAIRHSAVEPHHIDRLAHILADFYRHASPTLVGAPAHLADWRRRLTENRNVLCHAAFGLEQPVVDRIDRAQRRFLVDRADLLEARVRERSIVEGHGDLRPEHVSLAEPISIIDRLEFNPRFRICDPFDELASLEIECGYLGGEPVSRALTRKVAYLLADGISPALATFYRCYRATLRARLSIAHLFDPDCRTPEKWPKQAAAYLGRADLEAARLGTMFSARRRDGPPPA